VRYCLPPAGAPVRAGVQLLVLNVDVATEHEVVDDGHAPEERNVLKGAGHAQGGDAGGREPGELGAVETDGAPLRVKDAADAVEQGGLARAVGTDDGQDLALLDVEADAAHGLDAAERLRDIADLDEGAHTSEGASTAPSEASPRTDCAGKARARNAAIHCAMSSRDPRRGTGPRASRRSAGLESTLRAPAPPAQPRPGGRHRKGGPAPLRESTRPIACGAESASRRDSPSAGRRRSAPREPL